MYEFSVGFCQLRLTDADIGLFTGVVLATAGMTASFIVIFCHFALLEKNLETISIFDFFLKIAQD